MAKDPQMSQQTYDRLKEIGRIGGTVNTNNVPYPQKVAIINAVNDGKKGQ